jgi:hypothetical protein
MQWPRLLTIPRAPDFVIGEIGDVYLRRWWVIPRNRWFNIYLHHFCRSDDDRALHDHPWANCSMLLRGSYFEHQKSGVVKLRRPFRPVLRWATTAHRVELINGANVWTLFVTGPRVREWGFLCPKGWRHWREFCAVREGGNSIGRGCE